MSKSNRPTRDERRRAELEDRRARRRSRRTKQERSLLLPLSLGAVAVGVVGIIVFALVTAPPPAVDVRPPTVPSAYPLADGQALGRADAPLTIEIYSDFQCPACGVLANSVKPQLVRDYVDDGQVRLVYRDFAFLGAESTAAAVAGQCAAQQNRFWQYHDYLFANQQGEDRGAFSAPRLEAMAEGAGLELEGYRACVADPTVRQRVLDERAAAAAVPIQSTPTLVLDGEQQIVGVPDYAALRAAIDERLTEADAQP
ncbi:MAG TPA: thioredoxin domain-containing protein [Candidatus Limnocylindria bacterium]|nr:thioredoxin domain-containing protein [Candidatus Limnocylindria bacterium]